VREYHNAITLSYVFKREFDKALGAEGIKGYGGRGDQDIEFDDHA